MRFPGKDGGRQFVSEPQGPETGEKREYAVPAQRQRIMDEHLCAVEPRTDGQHHGAQERKRRPGRIQTPEPSAQGGGVGHAVWIFDGGRRIFPRTALHEIVPQRLAAGNEAVVAVGRRERRQECDRLPASPAKAAPNPDPIMMFVMRLFAAAAMTDDGVLQTNRASAENNFRTGLRPIRFGIDLIGGKWDKENRSNGGSAWIGDLAKIGTRAEPLLLGKNLNWEKNNAFCWRLSVRAAQRLAG